MGGRGGEGRADDISYARVVEGDNRKTSGKIVVVVLHEKLQSAWAARIQ
jgi:hypothetical protein